GVADLTGPELRALAGPGSEITVIGVPIGTGTRIALDRDRDGYLNGDEIVAGSDPANPASIPATTGVTPEGTTATGLRGALPGPPPTARTRPRARSRSRDPRAAPRARRATRKPSCPAAPPARARRRARATPRVPAAPAAAPPATARRPPASARCACRAWRGRG